MDTLRMYNGTLSAGLKERSADTSVFVVVGFEGAANDPCDFRLPILLNKNTGRYAKYSPYDPHPPDIYTREFLKEQEQERKVTLLPEVDEENSWPLCERATMLFVREELLAAAQLRPTFRLFHGGYDFREIREGTWACCLPKQDALKRADAWAERIKESMHNCLVNAFQGRGENLLQETERLAKLARYASNSREVRLEVCLRWGVAILYSERNRRLANLHRVVARMRLPSAPNEPCFPKWQELENFEDAVKREAENLREKAASGVNYPLSLGPPEKTEDVPDPKAIISYQHMIKEMAEKMNLDVIAADMTTLEEIITKNDRVLETDPASWFLNALVGIVMLCQNDAERAAWAKRAADRFRRRYPLPAINDEKILEVNSYGQYPLLERYSENNSFWLEVFAALPETYYNPVRAAVKIKSDSIKISPDDYDITSYLARHSTQGNGAEGTRTREQFFQ